MRMHDNKVISLPVAVLLHGLAAAMGTGWLHAEEKTMLTLLSSAFTDGGAIPARYTCEGDDIAPPLAWEGVPENTRSLVLIVDDSKLVRRVVREELQSATEAGYWKLVDREDGLA